MAREVHDREQEVAKLELALGNGCLGGKGVTQLGNLLLDLGQDRGGRSPVEPDAGGAFLQLERTRQCREGKRHVGQYAAVVAARRAFRRLAVLPHGPKRRAPRHLLRAEHVRMPLDHLVGDRVGDLLEVEPPLLSADLRVVDDLQQQVAEFAGQGRPVFALDRIGDLVRLLDRVRHDRGEGLLDVPGAAPLRIPQAAHHRQQPVNAARCKLAHNRLP